MLQLEHVTLTYPDGTERVTALNDVSLTVPNGTAVAITGPSGSGKSSLLAVAATLTRADSGRVLIGREGSLRDVARDSRSALAKVRRDELGIIFQNSNLIPSLTVREQLEVMSKLGAGTLRKLSKGELRARIDETLTSVGLEQYADRLPAQLSGGQRQRANIARAIVHGPSTLLVDEPTASLDQARGDEIIDLIIRQTHERGLATIVVTHELEHMSRFDATSTMVDGNLSPRD